MYPVLSFIELEKCGHKFVRKSDDCNIYVKTERTGIRVIELQWIIEEKLRLKVNEKNGYRPSMET